jgi:hypothetical protein
MKKNSEGTTIYRIKWVDHHFGEAGAMTQYGSDSDGSRPDTDVQYG